MYSYATTPPTIETKYHHGYSDNDHTFDKNAAAGSILYVPNGSESAYSGTDGWNWFGAIIGIDTTGIKTVENGKDSEPVGYYTLDGRKLEQPQQGVNIVVMSDGTTKKVYY